MNRSERIEQYRTNRNEAISSARFAKTQGMDLTFVREVRRAKFNHKNMMVVALAEWA